MLLLQPHNFIFYLIFKKKLHFWKLAVIALEGNDRNTNKIKFNYFSFYLYSYVLIYQFFIHYTVMNIDGYKA